MRRRCIARASAAAVDGLTDEQIVEDSIASRDNLEQRVTHAATRHRRLRCTKACSPASTSSVGYRRRRGSRRPRRERAMTQRIRTRSIARRLRPNHLGRRGVRVRTAEGRRARRDDHGLRQGPVRHGAARRDRLRSAHRRARTAIRRRTRRRRRNGARQRGLDAVSSRATQPTWLTCTCSSARRWSSSRSRSRATCRAPIA